jgi:biopolymer transport protein ExbD
VEIGDPKSLKSDINVTPLVDVMLVMLIIFMLVTPLLQKGVGVSLPQARHVQAVPDDEKQAVVLALRKSGDLYLGNEPLDRGRLAAQLRLRRQAKTDLVLLIRADREVPFGEIKRLVQIAREAGFDAAALVAEEIKENGAKVPTGG